MREGIARTLHAAVFLASSAAAAWADDEPVDLVYTTLAEEPQVVPRSTAPPAFFDFARSEWGFYVGAVHFSSEFEADPTWALGVAFRVPLGKIFGGKFGLWAEAFVANIERDLPPWVQEDDSGMFYGGAFGADFQFVRSETFLFFAQAGVLYATFGDIAGVDDGFGGVLGLKFGAFTIRRNNQIALIYNPQISYDGEDWFAFHFVGVQVDF